MKNKPFYIFLVVVVFVATVSWSQTALSKTQQDELKTTVQKQAAKTRTIQSDFEQVKHIDMLENEVTSKGMLAFVAPDNILWQYKTPNDYKVVFKEEMLFVNNEGRKEEIKLSGNRLFRSFNALIVNSIKGDMFDEDQFEIAYFMQNNNYLVQFFPKEKRLKRFIASFELLFEKTSGQVIQVKLIEPNADYTTITFSNRKTNIDIPAKAFEM